MRLRQFKYGSITEEIPVKSRLSAIFRLCWAMIYGFGGLVITDQDMVGYFFPQVLTIDKGTYKPIRIGAYLMLGALCGAIMMALEPLVLSLFAKSTKE